MAEYVDPAFARVKEVFHSNFEEGSAYPEIGAAFAAYAGGRQVINIWGGVADPASGRKWTEDTLVHVFSTTKGLLSVGAAMLADQGRLSYDDPIAHYWPEFAAGGKQDITVAHVLSHQAGLNGFDEETTVEDLGDWNKIVARLAKQEPYWTPGTQTSYHATTFGYLIGEVIRRITGQMPRQFVTEVVAKPLGLDVSIGVPEKDWGRVATLTPPAPPPGGPPKRDPIAARALTNPMTSPAQTGTPFWRTAQIPAINGHVTAQSMARLWGTVANGGQIDGVRLLSSGAIDSMRKPLSTRPDLMMGPGSWGAGVLINRGGLFGPNPKAFGNCGFGGSTGFADAEAGIGASYTPNRLFPSVLQDPRGMALANALAECAGRAGS